MKRVKVGIVGCGNISGIYLKNLTTTFSRIVEVVACCDIIPERAVTAAEQYNIKSLSVDKFYTSPEIELVLNITNPAAHFEVGKRALTAGKHLYIEKPLSIRFEEGCELNKIANEKNLFVGGAPDTFMGGGIQTCRKLIDDGFIGEPIGATAFMVCHGHESWHPDPEFYYQVGGGPMFDMGPYYLTALVTLMGPAAEVAGMTNITFPTRTITSEKKHGNIIDVEIPTHVTGSVRFQNGAIANIITSFDVWGSTLPRIEIYGSRGTLVVPDPNTFDGPILIKSAIASDFMPVQLTHGYQENNRGLGLADMAYCISSGKQKNRASGELTNHVLEIMHAFHISSDTHSYVKLQTTCSQPEPLPLGLIKGDIK